jgi:aspartyl-tRNA(Asn)/glutamyl-tRNA(Gln) amidotransferase subunit C
MVSKEEIQNLAQLARLKISDEEVAGLQKDISAILEYVGQVNAVPGGEGGVSYSPLTTVMREDVVRAENDPLASKEEVLRAAFPRREGDFAVVRKIIEKDE